MRATSPDDWEAVSELLDGALALPSDQRGSFLDGACPNDPGLRERVVAMLARAESLSFFDVPASELAAPLLTAAEQASDALELGAPVGPWRILREIGRGGMGAVYLAERADGQYDQQVALKVVKRGMDSDEILRRFRAERRILARLAHPGIARLLDGGVTAAGRPWFALEHVDGSPITAHCDTHRLEVGERLRLFEQVCDAIRYAHQNLVVHRDLKPSNVLVTEDGRVKLLDFGIAKLLIAEPEGALTEAGSRLMTPEYAAPEQVRGDPITTATDVYTLGALLYELLSGHRAHRLERRTPAELERVIAEVDPPEPSRAIRQSPDPRPIAAARGITPDRLVRQVRGDLDTIALTALRKDPARRYPTAEALLDDLRRHREGLPVRARADSRAYRTRKFVRRHRVGVVAAAAVLLSLAGGLTATAWQARAAARQSARAEREASTAREVKEFVVGLFEVSDPAESRGREITARELLERGTQRLDTALAAEPAVRSELLGVLGVIHRSLGLYPPADTLLARAVSLAREVHGDTALPVAQLSGEWARVLLERGEYGPADSLLRRALAIRRRAFGAMRPEVAELLNNLAALESRRGEYGRAESLYREALRIDRAHYGSEHDEVAMDLNNLGVALWSIGRHAAAESAYGEALAIRRRVLDPDHPSLLTSLHNLASLRESRGDHAGAERLRVEVLAGRRRVFPAGHPDIARALVNLASSLQSQERFAEADSLRVEALAILRARLGPRHPETLGVVNGMGIGRFLRGEFAGAEALFREVIAAWQTVLGPRHPSTLVARDNLAGSLQFQGKVVEAEREIREVLSLRRQEFGASHRDVASSHFFLGRLLHDRGDLAGAEDAYRAALTIRRAVLPAGAPALAWPLAGLGEVLTERGRPREAEPLLREALAIWEKEFGSRHHRAAAARRALGACLAALGRRSAGEQLLLASHADLAGDRGGWQARYERKKTLGRLVAFYRTAGDTARAANYARLLGAVGIRKPPDSESSWGR